MGFRYGGGVLGTGYDEDGTGYDEDGTGYDEEGAGYDEDGAGCTMKMVRGTTKMVQGTMKMVRGTMKMVRGTVESVQKYDVEGTEYGGVERVQKCCRSTMFLYRLQWKGCRSSTMLRVQSTVERVI